jgi:hypothetical protein
MDESKMIISKECYERGCACYDDRIDKDGIMISEIDISDMKALYDMEYGKHFKLAPTDVVSVPPASEEFTMGDVFKFMGIDGMYSKCIDSNGTMHHFAAWTKVVPWVK